MSEADLPTKKPRTEATPKAAQSAPAQPALTMNRTSSTQPQRPKSSLSWTAEVAAKRGPPSPNLMTLFTLLSNEGIVTGSANSRFTALPLLSDGVNAWLAGPCQKTSWAPLARAISSYFAGVWTLNNDVGMITGMTKREWGAFAQLLSQVNGAAVTMAQTLIELSKAEARAAENAKRTLAEQALLKTKAATIEAAGVTMMRPQVIKTVERYDDAEGEPVEDADEAWGFNESAAGKMRPGKNVNPKTNKRSRPSRGFLPVASRLFTGIGNALAGNDEADEAMGVPAMLQTATDAAELGSALF